MANALIHQDFTVTGAGPMVEIYDDRIEVTNPGTLLPGKKPDRLIGTTPESRKFTDMSIPERVEACYQHAALQYLSSQTLTNTTLRERFSSAKGTATRSPI
jgi:ATP-dependent DNA helicase RecG